MFDWLRRFFYSADPDVKIAAGLGEPEAEMWLGLLKNSGIAGAAKNMSWMSVTYGWRRPHDFDLWVKQSDLDRALEVLAPLLEAKSDPAGGRARRFRRRE